MRLPRVDGALDAAIVGVPSLDAVRDGGSTNPDVVHTRAAQRGGAVPAATATNVGRLTLHVASTHPLEAVAAAHERLAGRGLRGRIVLKPRE